MYLSIVYTFFVDIQKYGVILGHIGSWKAAAKVIREL